MPDSDLAAFVKGDDGPAAPTVKSCPFCSAELLPKAQKCKFCGSWVVSADKLVPDWRDEPVTPGQVHLLKNLKVPIARGLTRGVAADRLSAARQLSPAAFESLAGEGHRPGKSFSAAPLVAVALILILAGAAYGLYTTGMLDGPLGKVRGRAGRDDVSAEPVVESYEAGAPVPGRDTGAGQVAEHRPEAYVRPPVSEDTAVAEPGEAAPGNDPLAEAYRARFKKLPAGTKVTLATVAGAPVKGRLKYVTDDAVCLVKEIKADRAEVVLRRRQLSPMSRAALYESDYVAFMLERHAQTLASDSRAGGVAMRLKREQAERTKMHEGRKQVQVARMKARRRTQQEEDAREEAARAVRNEDMSMREWMENNGMSDKLKARQERVKSHESGNPGM